MDRLHGILVPMITPFTPDDELDLDALRAHIDRLIAAGVHGLIPAGSTGEAMSLTAAEYRAVVKTTIDHVAGRVPVVAGCSANPTSQVIANCTQAAELGADAIMLVHPFYSLPDERELYHHYAAVSAAARLPVMIYNNPFSTGVDSLPPLLARLSELPNLDYVKESSGDCSRIAQIIGASDGRLDVFSGTDNQALEHFAAGAIGWVAGTANAIPSQCVELYELAVLRPDLVSARNLYLRILPYVTLAESTGKFVQVNKAAVEFLGGRTGSPRAPLLEIDDDVREQMQRTLTEAIASPSLQPA